MIFGDPYRFAVWVEPVSQWSGSYTNGLFHLIINGNMYPSDIRTSTLSSDLREISDNDCALVSQPLNRDVFTLSTQEAFSRLFNLAYPESSELDEYPAQVFDYCIKSSNVSDFGACFFAVADEDSVRIIGGKTEQLVKAENDERNVWRKIDNPIIEDVIISKDDMNEIISSIRNFSEKLIK